MNITEVSTKKYRKAGLAVIIALLVMLLCNDLFLKEFFARPRPYYMFNLDALLADKEVFIQAGKEARFDMLVEKITAAIEKYPEFAAKWASTYHYPEFIEKLTSLSFPSGHTSSAFAAAIAMGSAPLTGRIAPDRESSPKKHILVKSMLLLIELKTAHMVIVKKQVNQSALAD